jgi:hypothetical protein
MASQKRMYRWLAVFLVGSFLFLTATLPLSAQEFRKASELKGVIVGSVETGKLLLSSGDKMYIGLDKELPLKQGDALEFFQVALLPEKEGEPPLFRRVGQGTLLEIVSPQLLVGIIDQSIREIAVEDRVFFGSLK